MMEERRLKLLSVKKDGHENCSVLNESFEGYIVLENKLNSINLDGLLSYKYTLSSSSLSDNTPETNRADEALTGYWCYITGMMNRRTENVHR